MQLDTYSATLFAKMKGNNHYLFKLISPGSDWKEVSDRMYAELSQ